MNRFAAVLVKSGRQAGQLTDSTSKPGYIIYCMAKPLARTTGVNYGTQSHTAIKDLVEVSRLRRELGDVHGLSPEEQPQQ